MKYKDSFTRRVLSSVDKISLRGEIVLDGFSLTLDLTADVDSLVDKDLTGDTDS